MGQRGSFTITGFGEAANAYFGKDLKDISLPEAAMLAGMVQAPSRLAPTHNLALAQKRSRLVLQEMADAKLVSAADAEKAEKRKLDLLSTSRRSATQSAFLSLVRRQLAMDYPMKELERAGLRVLTTFDPGVQAAAERALTTGIAALGANAKELDGAVVVTSPHTGEVNAIVGGRSGDGFNRALDARRPIGSLIKPAIYLTALESGRYTLASVIDDSPIDVKLDNGDVWSPHDYDGEARFPFLFFDTELLESLSPQLKEIARLRMRHPSLSMRELGRKCVPAVSKSSAQRRLNALLKLAKQ